MLPAPPPGVRRTLCVRGGVPVVLDADHAHARVLEVLADTLLAKAGNWDPSKHPRDPGGEGGGQFIEAGTSAAGGVGAGAGTTEHVTRH